MPVEPQVFEVLAYLVEHRDRVVPKEELMDTVWGGRFVSETAVTSRIKQARQAVGDNGHAQRLIRTVHGKGYRFVGPVAARRRQHRAAARAPVRYAVSDGLHIAYQVTGGGDRRHRARRRVRLPPRARLGRPAARARSSTGSAPSAG